MPTSRGECHSSEVRVRLSQSKLFIVFLHDTFRSGHSGVQSFKFRGKTYSSGGPGGSLFLTELGLRPENQICVMLNSPTHAELSPGPSELPPPSETTLVPGEDHPTTEDCDMQSPAPPGDDAVIHVVFSRGGNTHGKTSFNIRLESTTIEDLIRRISAFMVTSPVDFCTTTTTLQIEDRDWSMGFCYGKSLSEAGVSNGSEVTACLPIPAAATTVLPVPGTTGDLPTILTHEHNGATWKVDSDKLAKHFQETMSGPYSKVYPHEDENADYFTVQTPRDMNWIAFFYHLPALVSDADATTLGNRRAVLHREFCRCLSWTSPPCQHRRWEMSP